MSKNILDNTMEIISETVIAKITIYIIVLLIQTPENIPFNLIPDFTQHNDNKQGTSVRFLTCLMQWLFVCSMSSHYL